MDDGESNRIIVTACSQGLLKAFKLEKNGHLTISAYFHANSENSKLTAALAVPVVDYQYEALPVDEHEIGIDIEPPQRLVRIDYDIVCLVGFANGVAESWVLSSNPEKSKQHAISRFHDATTMVSDIAKQPSHDSITVSLQNGNETLFAPYDAESPVMVTYKDGFAVLMNCTARGKMSRHSYFTLPAPLNHTICLLTPLLDKTVGVQLEGVATPAAPSAASAPGTAGGSVAGSGASASAGSSAATPKAVDAPTAGRNATSNEAAAPLLPPANLEVVVVSDFQGYHALPISASEVGPMWHRPYTSSILVGWQIQHGPRGASRHRRPRSGASQLLQAVSYSQSRTATNTPSRRDRSLPSSAAAAAAAAIAASTSDGGPALGTAGYSSDQQALIAAGFIRPPHHELAGIPPGSPAFTDTLESRTSTALKQNMSGVGYCSKVDSRFSSRLPSRVSTAAAGAGAETGAYEAGAEASAAAASEEKGGEAEEGAEPTYGVKERNDEDQQSDVSSLQVEDAAPLQLDPTKAGRSLLAGPMEPSQRIVTSDLFQAKRDSRLIDLFTQSNPSPDGTISLEDAVEVMLEWMQSGQGLTKDSIWELFTILEIPEDTRLKFIELAKIAAVLSSALKKKLVNKRGGGSNGAGSQKLPKYKKLRAFTQKVTYNSMGEKKIEKVYLDEKTQTGLFKGYASDIKKLWNAQQPRVITQSESAISQPRAVGVRLAAIPADISKLVPASIGGLKVPDTWSPDNPHWFHPLRVIRIARTLLDIRSTKQHEVFQSNSLFKAGSANVERMPHIVIKYFERNYGELGMNTNIARQKISHFLEACLHYQQHPIVNILQQMLKLDDRSIDSEHKMVALTESSTWLCAEARSLMYSRGCVTNGDMIQPFDTDFSHTHVAATREGAALQVRWQYISRANAMLCVDEMIRERGMCGAEMYRHIQQVVREIPAVYSVGSESGGSGYMPAEDGSEAPSLPLIGMIDFERFLEALYFEFIRFERKIHDAENAVFGDQAMSMAVTAVTRDINHQSRRELVLDDQSFQFGSHHHANLLKIKDWLMEFIRTDPQRTGTIDQELFHQILSKRAAMIDCLGPDNTPADVRRFEVYCREHFVDESSPEDTLSYIDMIGALLGWEAHFQGEVSLALTELNKTLPASRSIESSFALVLLEYFSAVQALPGKDPIWTMGTAAATSASGIYNASSIFSAALDSPGDAQQSGTVTAGAAGAAGAAGQLNREGMWNPNTTAPSELPGQLHVQKEVMRARSQLVVAVPTAELMARKQPGMSKLSETHIPEPPKILVTSRIRTTVHGETLRPLMPLQSAPIVMKDLSPERLIKPLQQATRERNDAELRASYSRSVERMPYLPVSGVFSASHPPIGMAGSDLTLPSPQAAGQGQGQDLGLTGVSTFTDGDDTADGSEAKGEDSAKEWQWAQNQQSLQGSQSDLSASVFYQEELEQLRTEQARSPYKLDVSQENVRVRSAAKSREMEKAAAGTASYTDFQQLLQRQGVYYPPAGTGGLEASPLEDPYFFQATTTSPPPEPLHIAQNHPTTLSRMPSLGSTESAARGAGAVDEDGVQHRLIMDMAQNDPFNLRLVSGGNQPAAAASAASRDDDSNYQAYSIHFQGSTDDVMAAGADSSIMNISQDYSLNQEMKKLLAAEAVAEMRRGQLSREEAMENILKQEQELYLQKRRAKEQLRKQIMKEMKLKERAAMKVYREGVNQKYQRNMRNKKRMAEIEKAEEEDRNAKELEIQRIAEVNKASAEQRLADKEAAEIAKQERQQQRAERDKMKKEEERQRMIQSITDKAEKLVSLSFPPPPLPPFSTTFLAIIPCYTLLFCNFLCIVVKRVYMFPSNKTHIRLSSSFLFNRKVREAREKVEAEAAAERIAELAAQAAAVLPGEEGDEGGAAGGGGSRPCTGDKSGRPKSTGRTDNDDDDDDDDDNDGYDDHDDDDDDDDDGGGDDAGEDDDDGGGDDDEGGGSAMKSRSSTSKLPSRPTSRSARFSDGPSSRSTSRPSSRGGTVPSTRASTRGSSYYSLDGDEEDGRPRTAAEQRMEGFLRKVQRSMDGHDAHPRMLQHQDKKFFMPMSFANDIYFDPFETITSTYYDLEAAGEEEDEGQGTRDPLSQPDQADIFSMPEDKFGTGSSRPGSRIASSRPVSRAGKVGTPLRPPDMEKIEAAVTKAMEEDAVPQELKDVTELPMDPFWDVDSKVTEFKKNREEQRRQMFRTSMAEVPSSEWIRVWRMQQADWEDFFKREQQRIEDERTVATDHRDAFEVEMEALSSELAAHEEEQQDKFREKQKLLYQNIVDAVNVPASIMSMIPEGAEFDVEPLPQGKYLTKKLVTKGGYQYFQIEHQEARSILTVELQCTKGLADLYLSFQRLPSFVKHDYRVFCTKENNRIARLTFCPFRKGTFLVAVHSPVYGAQFNIWCYASAPPPSENATIKRVAKTLRKFEILSQHDEQTMGIHFPRLEKEARERAEREESEMQHRDEQNSCKSVVREMKDPANAEYVASVLSGSVRSAATSKGTGKGKGEGEGKDQQQGDQDQQQKSSEGDAADTGVAVSRNDDDEDDAEQVEMFIVKAGRQAMRVELEALEEAVAAGSDADSVSTIFDVRNPNDHRDLFIKPRNLPSRNDTMFLLAPTTAKGDAGDDEEEEHIARQLREQEERERQQQSRSNLRSSTPSISQFHRALNQTMSSGGQESQGRKQGRQEQGQSGANAGVGAGVPVSVLAGDNDDDSMGSAGLNSTEGNNNAPAAATPAPASLASASAISSLGAGSRSISSASDRFQPPPGSGGGGARASASGGAGAGAGAPELVSTPLLEHFGVRSSFLAQMGGSSKQPFVAGAQPGYRQGFPHPYSPLVRGGSPLSSTFSQDSSSFAAAAAAAAGMGAVERSRLSKKQLVRQSFKALMGEDFVAHSFLHSRKTGQEDLVAALEQGPGAQQLQEQGLDHHVLKSPARPQQQTTLMGLPAPRGGKQPQPQPQQRQQSMRLSQSTPNLAAFGKKGGVAAQSGKKRSLGSDKMKNPLLKPVPSTVQYRLRKI